MTEQRKAAMAVMSEWLAHPQELGREPARLEIAGEFDLHDLHYYIFKYKKSLLSKWLLGVCGGYEGDKVGHCGHVFSEMEPYDPDTAQEKAIAMVEKIRQYWMDRAQEEIKRQGEQPAEKKRGFGPFAGFVLLSTPHWDPERFKADLKEAWGVELPPEEGAKADPERPILVCSAEAGTLSIALMDFPVPDGEAEENAHSNYFTPEAALEAAQAHQAHLVVAVLNQEGDPIEAGKLYVKAAAACLKASNALGVYANGTVWTPDYFLRAAEDMRDGGLPLLALVFVGLYRGTRGLCGYTRGLNAFGRDELEVLESEQEPRDIQALLFNVSSYLIQQGGVLRDGETLGYTAKQKLPLTRSEGVAVDGMSIKIGF